MTPFELFVALKKLNLLEGKERLWWPKAGEFDVVIGAILTQQTKWEKVEASLANLHTLGIGTLEGLTNAPQWVVAQAITPSGFYNTKAKRLIDLSHAIIQEFHDFPTFKERVTREWLLEQKGVGAETADSILCYGCYQEAFVVDAYTARLLHALGIFEPEELAYETMQGWFVDGLCGYETKVNELYGKEISTHELYAHFHGMIVEFCKVHSAKKGCCVEMLVS